MGSAAQPFRVTYFGRLAVNKGIDRMIVATGLARQRGVDVHLRIIGDGECRESLRLQAREANLEAYVEFEPPVTYGEPLFRRLEDCHACVAAPLIEDTPRAAFDAFSRGLPIIAFDIAYFRDLAQASSGSCDAVAEAEARCGFVRLTRTGCAGSDGAQCRAVRRGQHAGAMAAETSRVVRRGNHEI
jgi:glycosyltransferase involved in cell wall biosynthesis